MNALEKVKTRRDWAALINSNWRKSLETVLETGRNLIAAKAALPFGEFGKMVADDLDFSAEHARSLMQVARHPEISNPNNSLGLPARMSVLIELAPLSAEDFRDAQAKGLIEPSLKTNAARAITAAYSKPEGETVPGGATHTLPSADEARKIARATGRFVAARDGHVYSGATKEEGEEYRKRRWTIFRLIEAIELIAEAPNADELWRDREPHWFVKFRPGDIDAARDWLASLKQAMGVIDA